MREVLGRIVMLVLSPLAYTLLYVLTFIDTAAYRIDRRFHTQLRTPKITVEEIQFLIETYLKIGSPEEDVITFLRLFDLPHSNAISFSDYANKFKSLQLKNHELEAESDIIKGFVSTKLKNTGKALLVKYDILIFFYFDEKHALIRYVTEGVATGL